MNDKNDMLAGIREVKRKQEVILRLQEAATLYEIAVACKLLGDGAFKDAARDIITGFADAGVTIPHGVDEVEARLKAYAEMPGYLAALIGSDRYAAFSITSKDLMADIPLNAEESAKLKELDAKHKAGESEVSSMLDRVAKSIH